VHTVSLRRTSVPTQDVTAKVTGSVMIIKVSTFSKGVGAKVGQYAATARARHLTGIVLDLRGNPRWVARRGRQDGVGVLDGGRS